MFILKEKYKFVRWNRGNNWKRIDMVLLNCMFLLTVSMTDFFDFLIKAFFVRQICNDAKT